jgi:hypothetical protein
MLRSHHASYLAHWRASVSSFGARRWGRSRDEAGEVRSQPSPLPSTRGAAAGARRQFGVPVGSSTVTRRGAGRDEGRDATNSLSRLRGRRLRDQPPLGARLAAQKERILRAGAHDHVGARAAPTRRNVESVHATIVAALRPRIRAGFHTRRIGRSWRRRAGRQTVKSKHICKCLTDQHLHLGMSSPRLTRCMTYSSHIRCPTCASLDVYGFEPTPTGQSHYCPACGKTWRVTVEDKTLDMIGASLAARRSKTRESG